MVSKLNSGIRSSVCFVGELNFHAKHCWSITFFGGLYNWIGSSLFCTIWSSSCLFQTADDRYACQFCGKTFGRKYHCKRHIQNMHTAPGGIECPICKQVFSRLDYVKVHISNVHINKWGSVLSFELDSDQASHLHDFQCMMYHTTVNALKRCCLDIQKILHSRLLACFWLKKQISAITPLNFHINAIYTNCAVKILVLNCIRHVRVIFWYLPVPPLCCMFQTLDCRYSCPHCPQTFVQKSHCTRHITSKHTAPRRFECPVCLLRFNRMEHVRSHALRVHMKDTSMWSICGETIQNDLTREKAEPNCAWHLLMKKNKLHILQYTLYYQQTKKDGSLALLFSEKYPEE